MCLPAASWLSLKRYRVLDELPFYEGDEIATHPIADSLNLHVGQWRGFDRPDGAIVAIIGQDPLEHPSAPRDLFSDQAPRSSWLY